MKTDTELLADLSWDSSIDHHDISVEVKDGIVALAGHAGHQEKIQLSFERSAAMVPPAHYANLASACVERRKDVPASSIHTTQMKATASIGNATPGLPAMSGKAAAQSISGPANDTGWLEDMALASAGAVLAMALIASLRRPQHVEAY